MRFLFFLLLFLVQNIGFAQNTAVVEVYAPKFKSGTKMKIVEFNPFIRNQINVRELSILNGKSSLKVVTGKGDRFTLKYNGQDLSLFLEPGTVKIVIPDTLLRNAKVSGSKSTQEMEQWSADWKKEAIYSATLQAQNKWLESAEAVSREASKKVYDSLKLIFDQRQVNFSLHRLKVNPAAYTNSTRLMYLMDLVPEQQISVLYEALNAEAKSNMAGRFIKYKIDSLFINGRAPDFVQSDTSGLAVKLADFAGKYVFIDFWASWCIPCRAEHPNLIKAYQQFKDRNFSIVAISLDTDKKLWLAAIKKDKLLWTQLSDLNGFGNEIAEKYIIKAVPSNFLISPDGKIIAKNLKGKELMETLAQLL